MNIFLSISSAREGC